MNQFYQVSVSQFTNPHLSRSYFYSSTQAEACSLSSLIQILGTMSNGDPELGDGAHPGTSSTEGNGGFDMCDTQVNIPYLWNAVRK